MQDWHTRGTCMSPTAKPMPFSARYSITPPAASSPNALPPLKRTACITSVVAAGFKSSVSLEAGPPPLTSTPAGIPFSHIITVHPVACSKSSAFPIFTFSISLISISLNGYFILSPPFSGFCLNYIIYILPLQLYCRRGWIGINSPYQAVFRYK